MSKSPSSDDFATMHEITDDDIEEAWEALDLISPSFSKIVLSKNVPQQFDAGTCIIITGRTKPKCLSFAIDFTVGSIGRGSGTIAFHFNPRIQEGYVVRNCQINGEWGDEETTSNTPLTLTSGKNFDINIYVTHEQFMVCINGRHFCAFRHRVSLERISIIQCIGDLEIDDVVYKYSDCYPFTRDYNYPISEIPKNVNYKDDEDLNLPVPFFGKLNGKLEVGSQIEICGRVKLLPHSFYVNLQQGLNLHPHPLVPLHLNPRFSASCGSNSFVRNCWIDGKWAKEERAPGFPFSPGYSFTMMIRIEEDCYEVWVNDKLIAEYPFRGVESIQPDAMYIQGDIALHHISVNSLRRKSRSGYSRDRFTSRL